MPSSLKRSTAQQFNASSAEIQAQVERYESLLEGVASSTNALLTGLDYYQSVQQALTILGEATQVDRIYIFRTHPHPDSAEPALSQRWEWVAPGISPEIDNPELQNLLYSECFPRWYKEFSVGSCVYGPVRDFPIEEKEILEPQGILSILVMPIQIQKESWGFVGFDQCKCVHTWTAVEISTLRAIAGSLGGAIARYTTEQRLQDFNRTLEARVTKRTQELTVANIELSVAMRALQETQAQLIHTEKMSSLGQLVAGIAHEINNPTNFIRGNLKHAQGYVTDLLELIALYQSEYPNVTPNVEQALDDLDFDFLKRDFTKLMKSTYEGVARITHIVRSLRNFSRLDEADYKQVDIHDGIESTLNFLQHRLHREDNTLDIAVVKHFDEELPMIECFSSSLNQAIMNILVNAIDVLEEKTQTERVARPNRIEIATAMEASDRISITITDNGNGMSPTVQAKMFDPFFTAKPIGKGTGLGLSIAHQVIVKEHSGEIICQSKLKQGTTFQIWLPTKQ